MVLDIFGRLAFVILALPQDVAPARFQTFHDETHCFVVLAALIARLEQLR